MKKIGDTLPEFSLKAVVSHDLETAFEAIKHTTHADQWRVLFFWPKDFTFVCPTEIAAFGALQGDFADRDAVLYGISTDSEYVHFAWRNQEPSLKNLPFPMLSDIQRTLSSELGILNEAEGVANRATFIVDPAGLIRFAMVNDMNVGRNPEEVLRVLDALQTDALCPCNWQAGDAPIQIPVGA